MIPFLVADRPISLSIIKGLALPRGATIGIMARAVSVSAEFREYFRSYPRGTAIIHPNRQPRNERIERNTMKMADSGIFAKAGCTISYNELFKRYAEMAADFGVIIDVMGDAEATVKSARAATKEYRSRRRCFKLVGVVQGASVDEYLWCYERLVDLGFTYIAVGGLLRRRKNTVRYAYVQRSLLTEVLSEIREEHDPTWLFVLGAFHPSRIDLFRDVGVWGSDYKGWIFNYAKKDEVLRRIRSRTLAGNPRIVGKGLRIKDVESMSEQELRFLLARRFIETRILGRLYAG